MLNPSWRQHTLPASTRPAVARQLCQLAKIKPDDVLLDPFCGCATIPIIALTEFGLPKAFASDLSGRAIDYAEKNRHSAKLSTNQLVIFRSNISMIKLPAQSISLIVTNLPFGIRAGSHEKNIKCYKNFCQKTLSLLSNPGRGIILTQEKKLFHSIFSPLFHVKKIATINIDGLTPDIFLIKQK